MTSKRLLPFYLFFCFVFCHHDICAQGQNVSLVSQTTFTENLADIWGYVDGSGVEYAVFGTRNFSWVYSLENPVSPVQRAQIQGTASTWRDFKSYGDRIYGTTDTGSDGILIINMSGAPSSITHLFFNPSVTVNGTTEPINKCHNLFIDEDGYMYLAGCNPGVGDVMIYDLNGHPDTPTLVHVINDRYSHDVYARDSMLYTSDIFSGVFSIYDVSDRANPVFVNSQTTGQSFTHNAWLSDDGDVLFTTDERSNALTEAYDISDPGNIQFLDAHAPIASLGTGVIPHNVHVHNDFLVTSHYIEGVVIVDAAQPDNLIQVGQYDTYPQTSSGFRGAWGAYPFLPSGLLLVSDINNGLFVLDPTYVRACYLRGTVRDINTNAAIPNVEIDILAPDLNEGATNNTGQYATGVVTPGVYDVVYSHPSYPSDTIQVNLANGITSLVDVFLGVPIGPCPPSLTLSGTAITDVHIADQSITSTATIDTMITVEYRANDEVLLDLGFEAKLGAQLTILPDGCP